jgi:type III secretion protein U
MSEKELPPTQDRIRKAREKGQLGVSQDLVMMVKLSVVAELAFAMEAEFRQGVEMVVNATLLSLQRTTIQPFSIRAWAVCEAAIPLGLISFYFVLTAAVLGWLGTAVQTKLNIAPKVFGDSLINLNPMINLKQIFTGRKLMILALGLLKMGSMIFVVGLEVWNAIPVALQTDRLEPLTIWQTGLVVFQGLLHSALFVIIFWALLDVGIQRWMNWRSMRMNHEEIKEEFKNAEGDPYTKSFRTAIGKEMLMSTEPLPKPAVLLVNPEHFAVALAYDYRADSVPMVVGKGVDEAVHQWREFAQLERIPVIRFRSLARQLYATGKVGEYVPSPMLAAVALLLQAAVEAAHDRKEDGDMATVYEIDEEMAKEMLSSAPSTVTRAE